MCLHFKKFDTANVLPESCFISCYLICDSKPTENSFQLRCPPHAIASWKNHIWHYWESISPVWVSPAPEKKHNHWVTWQFGRGWYRTLNESSAVNQGSFEAVLTWVEVEMLQGWGREGRKGNVFIEHWQNTGTERYVFYTYYHVQ